MHKPVLLNEVIAALAPAPGMRVIDGTFGAGGYSRAITTRGAEVLGIDQDPNVIAQADIPQGAKLVQGRFGDMAQIAQQNGFAPVDGVVLDIGVSSMQLDQAERGFSFMHDGPLDMRMSQSGISAADFVNSAKEEDIANVIYQYGEEPASRKIARYIVRAREEAPIERTAQLAEIVARAVRGKPGQHPATKTFQALRIHVNDELGELQRGLEAATSILKPGGKLVVVTFHSLEDRIVKEFIAAQSGAQANVSRYLPQLPQEMPEPKFTQTSRKAITPTAAECLANPRARSAKLRTAVRTPFFESVITELAA